jgi:hypothetical protein
MQTHAGSQSALLHPTTLINCVFGFARAKLFNLLSARCDATRTNLSLSIIVIVVVVVSCVFSALRRRANGGRCDVWCDFASGVQLIRRSVDVTSDECDNIIEHIGAADADR